jgi:hypothetical protein
MPLNTTTPVHRVTRMLNEGVRLMAVKRGQTSIDVTPDIIALLDGVGDANACGHGKHITSPLRGQVTPQQPQSSKP